MRSEHASLILAERSMGGALLFAMPALPLDQAGKYVAGAYVVFLVLVVVYVAIIASKIQRIEKELRELAGFADKRKNEQERVTADV